MEERTLVILGATGSIGTQTLDVLKKIKGIRLIGISFHRNLELALKIVKEFNVKNVAITGDVEFEDSSINIWKGPHSIEEMLEVLKPDITMVAVSGFSGLRAVLSSIEHSRRVCLANKESLVCGGFLVKKKLREKGTELIPVDSEHSAIFQVIEPEVEKIVLTASGGALRDWEISKIDRARPEDVLRHPVWNMGARITVDSATMVNKAFEVLEAMELFGLSFEKIEVKIHREGLVHGAVVLPDGNVKMVVSPPDMRIPISYALLYPRRVTLEPFFLRTISLSFEDPDPERYPAFFLLKDIKDSYTLRTVFNAADEVAVEAFLMRKIRFGGIHRVIEKTLEEFQGYPQPRTLDDVERIHFEARKRAERVTEWLSSTSY
ncbi:MULTISPECIES: 1-deoxy-D-xylulose-5-phosphate reductoisomerase [unclassified Thermotoga]|uniref:1-deoxy-D-xylulose-5-phosphate reductoisomerase n=1 Tax=unclassified Thermotoga TaxID=2631113 RepID=UPI000542F84C|nr:MULTISPECIES: 1-deoxy-D-xylulose-5-phosphate reductoisomerase [unclassified Thermotoga]KAF2959640.1 1-deoxy-D-xylulose 5-phosphate reductoisomerase [Thermotoga sp. 38H-to]KHC90665.1 1-deoxy-D-xylulose 5-phosphate reductoisomerase [Thermotoga sp. Mc24]